jgi:hypothetical protein
MSQGTAVVKAVPAASTFMAVALPDPASPGGEIRIEVRRSAATVTAG